MPNAFVKLLQCMELNNCNFCNAFFGKEPRVTEYSKYTVKSASRTSVKNIQTYFVV